MAQKVVIFSQPRSGSTWVVGYIKNIYEPNAEYFGGHYRRRVDIIESKIKNIDLNKSLKIFPQHLYRPFSREYYYDYREWFKNAFKDHQIIMLQRRNTWKRFLSWVFQQHTSWQSPHNLIIYENITVTKNNLDDFFNMERIWKNFDVTDMNPILWYYEDLTHKFLNDYFGTPYKVEDSVKKLTNNYESFINNLEWTKEEFGKRLIKI
jgi:LPS sulfotransferase NodH